MYDYTGNNWDHWNSSKMFKKMEAILRKRSNDSLQNTALLEYHT